MESNGRVILVGAGPGAPGLLTLAAVHALQLADLVLYDRLAGPTFRRFVTPTTELIDVGKRPGASQHTQSEIIARLIDEAQRGKCVARVKGGSPFVFGRGFEEVEACVSAGVDVEVIPGVTSAVGAFEASGIPLTHRGSAAGFAVISGHEDPAKGRPSVDWTTMAAFPGSIVILMGVATFPTIAAKLIAGGLGGATPVVAIEAATTPQQRSIRTTLDSARREFADSALESPAVIVVGEVASYADDLPDSLLAREAFDTRQTGGALGGWRIIVARTTQRTSQLAPRLRAAGATVVEISVLRFAAPADDAAILALVDGCRQGEVGLIAANSALAIQHLVTALIERGHDTRLLADITLVALSSSARAGFSEFGLSSVPTVPDHAGRIAAFLTAEDDAPDERAIAALESKSWPTEVVPVYRSDSAIPIREHLTAANSADAAVFASSASVRAWARIGLSFPPVVAAIGPTTAAALEDEGVVITVMPDTHDVANLTAALISFAESR